MAQLYILFGIRILSAVLLLLFFALIAWIAYQDLSATTKIAGQGQQSYGYLRVLASKNRAFPPGAIIPLLPITTIGRGFSCTVVLEDHYVSTEHAVLTYRENHWWLEDLDSSNGTLLNDLPLTDAAVLSAGDVIAIGDTRLKVEPAGAIMVESLVSSEIAADDD